MVVSTVRDWAAQQGFRQQYSTAEESLTVWIPSGNCETSLHVYEEAASASRALLSMGELDSGFGVLLEIPHRNDIGPLLTILDSMAKPVTAERIPAIARRVNRAYQGVRDLTTDGD